MKYQKPKLTKHAQLRNITFSEEFKKPPPELLEKLKLEMLREEKRWIDGHWYPSEPPHQL